MADVLLIIAQKGFRDEELLDTKSALAAAGKSSDVASITTAQATGSLGATVTPDLTVKEAINKSYKAVVVIGGQGSLALVGYPEVIKVLRQADSSNKVVAAICAGPVVLAKAGVISGKKATVFPDRQLIAAVEAAGAKYISEEVVVDGRLVTGSGPRAARKFGEAISKLI